MARNLYSEVTYRILNQLEAGTPPWVKEWKSIGRGNIPMNAVTKRPYSGGNIIFLWAHGYAVQRFLTFKQALDAGGSVRKGEHGVKVFYVSKMEKANDDGEKPNLIPFLKEYTVFNVAQCHGLPDEYLRKLLTSVNAMKKHRRSFRLRARIFGKVTGKRTTPRAPTSFRYPTSTPSKTRTVSMPRPSTS